MTESEQLNEEFASIDELGADEGGQQEAGGEQETRTQVKIPKKFEGKGLEDVVQSYSELEKELSRKNNEVGELRKLADEFLRLELENKRSQGKDEQTPPRKKLEVDDLLEDPESAISSAIDNHPKLKAFEEARRKEEIAKGKAAFEAKHSDWQDLLQTPDFQEWVTSSRLRQEIFHRANASYDYEAADELFSLYKQLNGDALQEGKDKAELRRKDAMRKGAVEKGGTGESRRKVFRRSDLVNLKLRQPEKYRSMLPEIERAYAEGRVR